MTNAHGNRGWAAVVAAILMMLAAAIGSAQTFTDLHNFDETDGGLPWAGLIQGTDGNLYGTTFEGGANISCESCGTIFKITPSGRFTTVHNFDGTDGAHPEAGLIQATNRNFYGTTSGGGANGSGTIFVLTLSGRLTTLYSFCSQSDCVDGMVPNAALVQGTDGNFYGTTYQGGDYSDNRCPLGCGTIFRITPQGAFTSLYSFCSQSGCPDGDLPNAALAEGTDGHFYGTTAFGGTDLSGTVFKITPSGTLTTLHTFCSQADCTDGARPLAAMIQATDGNFYGTTFLGGIGDGEVFRITPSGTLTTIYSFCQAKCADGSSPVGALVQGTDGNLYGATSYRGLGSSGSNGEGTVFRLTLSGTLTTIYSICTQSGCPNGAQPYGALVQDTSGKLYGSTLLGGPSTACGAAGCGTVFGLYVGLKPFVETRPTGGKMGVSVEILGTNLTGATSVTFNGTAATFTVESATAIKTTVPSGATTGPVQVVTPSGTLTSNVNFRVLP